MKGTLVLQILNIRSSFLKNCSKPAVNLPDTIQFWVTEESAWRIRTYALDHDIHVDQLGRQQIPGDAIEWLRLDSRQHFADEIALEYTIPFSDPRDKAEVQKLFDAIELDPRLEVADLGFCFWKPDEENYATQSTPDWA